MSDTEPQTDDQLDHVDRRLAGAFSHIEREDVPEVLEAHARELLGDGVDQEAAD